MPMSDNQVDLFLGSLIDTPLKDDRALMEYPFFAIEKQPQMEKFVYGDGRVTITVSPGEKGRATIYDKDLLIYCATYINSRIEQGLPVDRTIRCSAYDILRTTGRDVGSTDYKKLFDALFRLRSTTILTNIESDGKKEHHGFGWIDNYSIIERDVAGRKVAVGVEITINQWMFRALVRDRRVLTISKDYFKLTMGLERRLYELARKHCGSQPEWKIGLERLREKSGSKSSLRHFKSYLQQIIKRDSIPDYSIALVNDHASPLWQGLEKDGYRTRGASRRPNEKIVVLVTPRSRRALEGEVADSVSIPA